MICFNDASHTRIPVINAKGVAYANISINVSSDYSSTPLDINNATGGNIYDNMPGCWSTFLSPIWDNSYCNKLNGGFKRTVEVITLLAILVISILIIVGASKCATSHKKDKQMKELLLQAHTKVAVNIELA